MKNLLKHPLLIMFILLGLLSAAAVHAGPTDFVYKEKNAAREKKRYLVKLEQDKQKCEMAIQNTKTLISRSKNRPYLPELQLRLAELYIEKSRIVYFLRVGQQEGKKKAALDDYEANMLKQRAIEIYQRILADYPDFEQRDKVHFFLAHEFNELGQIKEMVTQYQGLINRFPQSMYTPEAHLLLGDYYFNQKQDLENAKAHYEAVLQYTVSPAAAAARYKLAWCRINQTDFKGALKLFEKSVSSPETAKKLDIDTYRRVDVRMESLIDMAYCYPEVFKKATAAEALAYFRKHAWSRQVYTTVVEKLASRYYSKKKWGRAAALYRELAELRQDPEKLIQYARYLFESTQATGDYKHAVKDVQVIVDALEKQKYSAHISDMERSNILHDFEIFTRDLITHLHEKARQSHSRKDFKIAAETYKRYLDFFDESPAAEDMASNYAEVLFSSEQYLKAGKQYEEITPAATVNMKLRREMLYSAVISYYQALKQKEALNHFDAAFARKGLRTAGNLYINEYPGSRYTPKVKFNVAWAAYDAGDYASAIADFSDFIEAYPHHEAADAAVHLVLDSYNLTEDYEGLIAYGKSLLKSNTLADSGLAGEVAQIVKSAESRMVSSMTVAAIEDWDNARQGLMKVAEKGGQAGMGEQALYSLVVLSRDKKDFPSLFQTIDKLARNYPGADNTREALGMGVATALKIGQYRILADCMERFVRQFPKDEQARDLILQAARIRQGLGQYADANRNFSKWLSLGKVPQQKLDDLVFSMFENAGHLKNSDAAMEILKTYRRRLSSVPRLRASAEIAILAYRSGRASDAKKFSSLVKKAYTSRMGEKHPVLRDRVAELYYREVQRACGPYFKLRLKNEIDNQLVTRKNQLLQELETGYQEVMACKSPHWALKACFRAHELNREFADFLLQSPVPKDLNPQEKRQYQALLREKAREYREKAREYVKTCVKLAHKWEICDPRLLSFYTPAEQPLGGEDQFDSLAEPKSGAKIARQALKNSDLLTIYKSLSTDPDDFRTQAELARAYLDLGDYCQAKLVARSVIDKLEADQSALRARLYNMLGLTRLYRGEDREARAAFNKALKNNQQMDAARVNLAGLYLHYGHTEKAKELVQERLSPARNDYQAVHQRTGALVNEILKPAE